MGTNFYWLKEKEVPFIFNEEIMLFEKKHIGKRSAGWRFIFDGTFLLNEKGETLDINKIKDGIIIDEYGRSYSYSEFLQLVEETYNNKNNKEPMDSFRGYNKCGKTKYWYLTNCEWS